MSHDGGRPGGRSMGPDRIELAALAREARRDSPCSTTPRPSWVPARTGPWCCARRSHRRWWHVRGRPLPSRSRGRVRRVRVIDRRCRSRRAMGHLRPHADLALAQASHRPLGGAGSHLSRVVRGTAWRRGLGHPRQDRDRRLACLSLVGPGGAALTSSSRTRWNSWPSNLLVVLAMHARERAGGGSHLRPASRARHWPRRQRRAVQASFPSLPRETRHPNPLADPIHFDLARQCRRGPRRRPLRLRQCRAGARGRCGARGPVRAAAVPAAGGTV